MASFGKHFLVDQTKGKSKSEAIKQGKHYRITVLTERLIRLEYSKTGVFNDSLTDLVQNRNFDVPNFKAEEDDKYLVINTKYFSLQYLKESTFKGPVYAPDTNLKVKLLNTDRFWYYGHPEARNFPASSFSLDDFKGQNKMRRGLYSLDGFVSITDNNPFVINEIGMLNQTVDDNIDLYLFMYRRDFGLCLKDYFTLTGYPNLIPRYALGLWWYRDKIYNVNDCNSLVDLFREKEMPLSVLLLGEFWHEKDEQNYNLYKSGYSFNKSLFPDPAGFFKQMHEKGVKVGINIDPVEGIKPKDSIYNEFAALKKIEINDIPFNALDKMFMIAYFEHIIEPIKQMDVDFFWIDYKENIGNLRILNYYHNKDFTSNEYKRPMLLTRNTGVAAHRNGVLYSGETIVSWTTLKYLPYFNCSASNMGLTWWSHDIGGFKEGIEDSELYTRYAQFGTFSPIFRLSAKRGAYYKREPWEWDYKTYNIVKKYITLRQRLIPYIYSFAYTYHATGIPLVQPLYYGYPELYDEPNYRNEYYFGNELFVCPITAPKDIIMNRTVQRLFLPKGNWYDYLSGKKYVGGKRYITFYKDEDYPVFAKAGAIIPLNHNFNSVDNPENLDIEIFPGKSNNFKLYEDDGITNLHEQGYACVTLIEYNYDESGYSVNISQLKGKTAVIPDTRNYNIIFRNLRKADSIEITLGGSTITDYEIDEDSNKYTISLKDISTSKTLNIKCKSKDKEIEASRLLDDDIDEIISDLNIPTSLKEEIAKIAFSEMPLKKKRIAIRRLKSKGLQPKFIQMFLKLYDYLAEI